VSRIVLLAILFVAALIRFASLGQQSFWDDEGYTVALMHHDFVGLIKGVAHTESAPPLYYIIAWCWTRVFGVSEVGLRSLSALAGVATVAAGYYTALAAGSRRAATIAAVVLAVNPLMIWYSQEARAYALFACFATFALVFFVRRLCSPTPQRRDLWAWAGFSALALATHYFSLFVVIPEAAVLLIRERRKGALVAPFGLLALVALAELPLALEQRHKAFGFAAAPLARRVAQIPEQFLVGYGVWSTPAGKLAALIGALAVAVGLALVLRRSSRQRPPAMLAAIALVALGAPVALAVFGLDYVLTLYFLAVVPLVVVIASLGWAKTVTGIAAALVYVVIASAVEAAVVATPEFQREDIRGVTATLETSCVDRAIVVTPPTMLSAYMRDLRPLSRSGAFAREIDVVAMAVKAAGEHETVPRTLRTQTPAPGFVLARRVLGERFTVVVFRSARPRRVEPSRLVQSRMGPWGASQTSVLRESCRSR